MMHTDCESAHNKIRVLFLSHSSELAGGAEKCLLILLNNLDREKIDPIVIFPTRGPFKDAVEQLNITTYISPMEWWVETEDGIAVQEAGFSERVRVIGEIIEKECPDIIHTNTSVIWEGAVAARIHKIRHVWHAHEILDGHPSLTPVLPLPFFYWVVDFLSDRVVTVSNTEKNELFRYISLRKLTTIYNGIEKESPVAEIELSLRDELKIPPGYTVALTLAYIAKYKGIDTLLDAAVLCKNNNDRIKFVLAGSGPEDAVQTLNERIILLGLEGVFYYLGFRNDGDRLLEESDFVLVPSVYESFSLVTIEAMAAGRPVITTDCGGPSELVLDGETGFIVPVGDPLAIREKMVLLAADAPKKAAMGRKGRERFLERFTAEKYGEQFQQLYAELLRSETATPFGGDEDELIRNISLTYQKYFEKAKKFAGLSWTIKNLQMTIAQRDKDIQLVQEQFDQAYKEIAHKDVQLAFERQHVRLVEHQVLNMMDSLSWRITRPLRTVHALLSRLLGRGGGVGSSPVGLPLFEDDHETLEVIPKAETAAEGRYDVIVFPVIDWNFRFQRPQQLSRQLGILGHRVFYLTTEFLYSWQDPGFRILESPCRNVFVVKLNCCPPHPNVYTDALVPVQMEFLMKSLLSLIRLCSIEWVVSIVDLPFWRPLVESLPEGLIVYDCMDHHAGFSTNTSAMLEEENLLLHCADLVVTSSERLSDIVGKEVPNVVVRNGAEVEFFMVRPLSLAFMSERPVVGYYGAISDWFDMELVIAAATALPDWDFVLVGATFGCDTRSAENVPNIRFTGEVPYGSLPGYLHAFDVCMIPFLLTELTLCTNPVKVYEYLSAGKPVVATAMPELLLMGELVHVATSRDQFVELLQHAMAERGDETLAARRRTWAADHDWRSRAIEIEQKIDEIFDQRLQKDFV